MPDITVRKPRVIDPGYRVPDTQPEDTICARVYIPNDILYIAAFWGHVFRLTQWLSWERGGTKARDAAEVWKAAYELSRTAWENCEGECGIVDIRQSEETPCLIEKRVDCDTWEDAVNMRLCVPRMRILNGVLQQDTTGEGNWVDAQDPEAPYDPRYDSYAPPPWETPPEGERGECLSAANVATYVNFAASSFADAMVDGLTFFQTLGVATTILATLLDIIPLTILTAAISTVYQLVVDNWEGVRDFDITSKLTELMVCRYNADGTMTRANFDIFIQDCEDWRATLTSNNQRAKWAIAILLMKLWGPVGMTLLGQIWGITTYECAYSECEWCQEFDFTTGQHGWDVYPGTPVYGTYQAGVGFVSNWGNFSDGWHERLLIQHPVFADSNVRSITFTFHRTPNHEFLMFTVSKLDGAVVNTHVQWSQGDGEFPTTYDLTIDYAYVGGENVDENNSLTISSMTICGVGLNPFEE